MGIIPALATKVKAAPRLKPPSSKRQSRIKHVVEMLPHYALHTNAPTLPELQQVAEGVFARLLVAYVAAQEGVSHDQ